MTDNVNAIKLQEKLWRAAERGDAMTVRTLFIEGVDFDARNEDGFTAFNLATQNGHHEVAMTILAAREMQYAQKIGQDPAEFYGDKQHTEEDDRQKTA